MTGLITLPFVFERPNPPFEGDAIRYPEGLVRHFLKKHTKKGARVFDPFSGLGTTLLVAEELGRTPYGIEADEQRHAWSAGQMTHWQNVVFGNAARMNHMNLPKMDFCMTSPPFMSRAHRWNPLYAGNPKHAGYDAYLRQMGRIFRLVAGQMKKNALVVVQVDNIPGRIYTPLVADFETVIGRHLTPVGETLVLWSHPRGSEQPGSQQRADYDHTTCLLFRS